ncbi:MAG: hypothetical protein BGO69_07775 [Bacteroidetes bacterium 46-16]|nr:MAG: hypothetical protein BGO69_07775 [Bacteroidetes bacterium 46-16]
MRNKLVLVLIFSFLSIFATQPVWAQKANADSAARARKAALEALHAAQKHTQDSIRAARQHRIDSMTAARKKVTDSLAAIRKYRNSKHYKDSVAKFRQHRLDSIKEVRQSRLDSIKTARQHVIDSVRAERKERTDSIKAVQKARAEKLAAKRKYRESKRYKDSVAVLRQTRLDSIRAVRKAYSDSMIAARKAISDSIRDARKQYTDSITAVRKKALDSMKAIRQARTDSLAKVKEKKEKARKVKEKEKQQKLDLALKLKIEKKHKAWSNESMLKKRWGVPRRQIQNTFTRYNYYFNANKKMDEALLNMQRINKENYDSLIALFPFNPDRDSSAIAPDMDSIIHKVSVGIQIHDPRTKWGDDLYMLLGEAYYYKGDYQNAIIAFRYTVSIYEQNKKKEKEHKSNKGEGPSILEEDKKSMLDFLKHQSVHNEAILWLARTFTQINETGNAESVLDLVEADPNFPESLKGRLALEKANIKLKEGNYKAASGQLTVASQDAELSNMLRQRCAFLAGQIYQSRHEDSAAIASYQQVLDLHPKIEMDFYTRKHMADCIMSIGDGKQQGEVVSSMKHLLKDGKYAPYYDQVYYLLGMFSLKTGNADEAITYLDKGIKSPKATKKQKAISYAHLGSIYYNKEDYIAAKAAYDSAGAYSKYVQDDKEVDLALRRSPVLGDVAGPVMTIHVQDSLLALAALDEREQRSAVRRYIRMLEDRRADSIYRAENAGVVAAEQVGNAEPVVAWYFSNPALVQQGYNDFKRKWGNRPLTDNWRRISAIGFVSNSNVNAQQPGSEDNDAAALEVDENGIPTEESLLALIPNTDAQKDKARRLVQRAYIDLANAYVIQLEDYPLAIKALDTLDYRYPQHEHKAHDLYLRYLVAIRQNKFDAASGYSAQLLKQYPNSQYAELVRPSSEDGAGMDGDKLQSLQEYYDATYDLLMKRQYTEVLQRVRVARKKYPDPKYNGRLTIVEGSALAGTGEYNTADTLLNDFLKTNVNDSLREWAEAVLRYIDRVKPKEVKHILPTDTMKETEAKIPAMPADSAATGNAKDKPAAANKDVDMKNAVKLSPPDKYTYKPQDEHYCVFVFPGYEARSMGVKAAIGDFNTFQYSKEHLATNIDMLNVGLGVVAIKKFDNAAAAKSYMNALKAKAQIFREYKPGEYKVLIISATNYLKLLADKTDGPYLNFYNENYK